MRTSFIQCFSFLALLSSVTALPTGDAEPVEAGVEARGNSGPGILLTNKSGKQETYYFYNNLWNGDGTAGPNFDHPNNPPTVVAAGATKFVPLSTSFKGRVQRGNTLPATWVEFQTKATDGNAHGDVSLEQGCDGAATITSVAGDIKTGGFKKDVVSGAPADALVKKPDGSKAIASTMGNWSGPPNQAAITYLNKVVGQDNAYITGGTGTPDIKSTNNQFKVVFF